MAALVHVLAVKRVAASTFSGPRPTFVLTRISAPTMDKSKLWRAGWSGTKHHRRQRWWCKPRNSPGAVSPRRSTRLCALAGRAQPR